MSAPMHTPGPWVLGEQNGHCGVTIGLQADPDVRIASAYLFKVTSAASWGAEHFALPENAEAIANARLIASAPCMADAGQSLLASLDPDTLNPEQFNAWCALTAAITKAKGAPA